MARRCEITGKGVLVGNNVSHANNKSKRRFLPNLQTVSLLSDALGESMRMRVSMHGLKTVEHLGGFDAWLLDTPDAKLEPRIRRFKQRVRKEREARAAAA